MKICQPVEKDQGVDNALHGHFATSPRFIIYDNKDDEMRSFESSVEKSEDDENECRHADFLNEQQVNIAIVGGIGRCGLEKLQKLGIKVFQAVSQNVESNIEAYTKGELKELNLDNTKRGYPC